MDNVRLTRIFLGCFLYVTQGLVAQDTLMLVGINTANDPSVPHSEKMLDRNETKTVYNEFGQKRYEVSYHGLNDSIISRAWFYDDQHRMTRFLHFWPKGRTDTTTLEYIDDRVIVKGQYDFATAEVIWTLDGKMVSAKSSRYKTSSLEELVSAYTTEVAFDSLNNCECQTLKSFYMSPEYAASVSFDVKPNFEYCSWFDSKGLISRKSHQNIGSLPTYTFFKHDQKGREIEKMRVYKDDTSYYHTSYTVKGDSLYEKSYSDQSSEYYLKVYLKKNVDRGPCYYAVFNTDDELEFKVEYTYDAQGYVLQAEACRKPKLVYDEFHDFTEDHTNKAPKCVVTHYVYQRFSKATFIPQKAYEPE